MKNVTLPASPGGWGGDDITAFIVNTRLNSFATYANFPAEYGKVAKMDVLFGSESEDRQHERPSAAVAPSMGPIPVM